MNVTVLIPFRDKDNVNVVYRPGDVKMFDADRAVALAARGLVKLPEEAPVQTEAVAESDTEQKPKRGRKSKKDDVSVDSLPTMGTDLANLSND